MRPREAQKNGAGAAAEEPPQKELEVLLDAVIEARARRKASFDRWATIHSEYNEARNDLELVASKVPDAHRLFFRAEMGLIKDSTRRRRIEDAYVEARDAHELARAKVNALLPALNSARASCDELRRPSMPP